MQGTNTERDSINKASICLKKLKETQVNLKTLGRINHGDSNKRDFLFGGIEQLIKISATIIKNKK
ncbi:MAG: hypothetical protein AAGB24_00400 [Bacteroidota bacterium]